MYTKEGITPDFCQLTDAELGWMVGGGAVRALQF